jgi:hypothetical protein
MNFNWNNLIQLNKPIVQSIGDSVTYNFIKSVFYLYLSFHRIINSRGCLKIFPKILTYRYEVLDFDLPRKCKDFLIFYILHVYRD